MTLPSSTSSTPQAKPGVIPVAIAVLIIVVLIGGVVGISFLANPYYAIGQVVLFAAMLALIAAKMRNCLRLAQGTAYAPKLHGIILWIALGVIPVVAHLGDLFGTDNRDYIRLATNVAIYLALLYALELVENLLTRVSAEATSPIVPSSAEVMTANPTVPV